jgi:S-adenosylmethionine:tRNA ribosyltransferase-isomerase
VKTAEFDYDLPERLIAQVPLAKRDESRLLVLERRTRQIGHRRFAELAEYLCSGDLLVLNNSRVIPARLYARKAGTGARLEVLLLEEIRTNDWWALLCQGKRAPAGTRLTVLNHQDQLTDIDIEVVDKNEEGHYRLLFLGPWDIQERLPELGRVPLPPYIVRAGPVAGCDDQERYQTVYAVQPGSVAAPTAGLHFTPALLERLRERGVGLAHVTLHVGAGTFAPVKAARPSGHRMHEERYELPVQTVAAVARARAAGRRVVAVGTTTVRVLEGVAAQHAGRLVPGAGRTQLFIFPPYRFRVVDGLITNFHLPRSTLLMLVSALAAPGETAGRDLVLGAYAEAIREEYRFYSYGDAMLMI